MTSIRRLVDVARSSGVPVCFTFVRYQRGGADGGWFYRKLPVLRCFDAGSPLAEPVEGLQPREGDVVVLKQYPSGFFGTSLASTLNARRVDTLILTGLTTSGCVRATVVDALQHGFRPVVVRDAVGDRDLAPHEANLFDIQAKYADVVSEQAVTEWLRGRNRGSDHGSLPQQ